jgi:NADH:ubiquinone oxidoreductase subunit 5 (subunit L)/multisubunit Na+/H+ antiporter MnhA subunit
MHGFFKAFSFMAMGNIIVFNLGIQDIRKIGNFFFFKKINFFFLTLSLISLGSAPLTLGFLAKHLFMNIFISTFNLILFKFLLFVGTLSAFVYSFKIILNLFFSPNKSFKFSVFSKKKKYKNMYMYDIHNVDYNFSVFLFFGLILAISILFDLAFKINLNSIYLYNSNFIEFSFNSFGSQFFGNILSFFYLFFCFFFQKNFFQKNFFQKNFNIIAYYPLFGFFFL